MNKLALIELLRLVWYICSLISLINLFNRKINVSFVRLKKYQFLNAGTLRE